MTTPVFDIPAPRAGTSRDVSDHNRIVTTLQALVAAVQGGGSGGGTPPVPVPTVTPDKHGYYDTSINNVLTSGQPAILPAGILPVQRPIVIPPGGILKGQFANEVATYLDSLHGTIIQPDSSWKQGDCPANAVVACIGQDDGSYSDKSEEQKGYGFMLDCHLLSGSSTDGIQLYGGISRTHWERILIAQAPRFGFNCSVGSGSSTGGAIRLNRVNVRYAGSDGIVLFKDSDVSIFDCLTENCGGNGFTITNLSNGMVVNCRAEHNGTSGVGDGFAYNCTNSSTGSGTAMFIGCSTDRNEGNGISITGPSAVPVQLVGCRFRRDGRNSGTGGSSLAGIYVTGYPGVVQMSGTTVFPGVNDSFPFPSETNSPDIGLRIHSNANGYVLGAACWFHGNAQGKADDGTGVASVFAASYKAFGGTSSFTASVA